jgi:membrane protein YfhO
LKRTDVIVVAALIAVATLAFADVAIGINNFYLRDLTRYYYPTKQILRDIVLHGEFPFWNRYFSAGQPIAANPEHEVFYPLTWLILLPSYDFGYRLHILIHIWIGLAAMYALLRSMELRPTAAAFGATAWGLGGLYMSYINLLPILFCAAWLPLTCLYTRRFLLHRNRRDFALASLFLGVQFLVGEPTTVMQTGVLLGMYALYRAWYTPRKIVKSIGRVSWIAAISIAGFLVGAAQIIPALDHVHDSARSRPFGFDLVSAWSMPWAKFAELLFPNILGHLSIDKVTWYWGGGLYPGMGSPFLFSIYCGLLVTALAIGGAFARPRGGRFVLLVVFVSCLFALGGHTPLLQFLYDHHILSSLRYPEKFAMMAIFALILFSSQMLQRLLDGDEDIREGTIGFVAAVFAIALLVVIAGFTPYYAKAMTKIWVLTPGGNANFIIRVSRIDWALAAARAGGAIALLVTIRTKKQKVWLAALAIFMLADILPIAEEVNPRQPRRFFQPAPFAAQLPANRLDYRVFHEADWYGQEEIAKKFFSTASGVYWVVRNGLFPMTPAGARVRTVLERDYDKTALLPTIDLVDCIWDVKRSGRADWWVPFMAMSNVWYRVEYANFDHERARNKGDWTRSLPTRLTPAPHYPRYYFADQIVPVKDRGELVKKLIANNYSDRVAFMNRPSFVPGRGVVHRVTESANDATIDVESFGQGFLVMSITPHKYWHVTVDGERVTPIVTNIAYQGVNVTAGKHRVHMHYSNPLVEIGGGISILTALLLIAIGARPRRVEEASVPLDAYEEPVHVVADAVGTHLEPAWPPDE